MKNHNEINFVSKFRLLHSQESNDEINWSLSDSSQEGPLNNITNSINLKKKRANYTRKKLNVSPLHILVKDKIVESPSLANDKSPILIGKSNCVAPKSPILTPSQHCLHRNVSRKNLNQSLVISHNNNNNHENNAINSPILLCMCGSPKDSPKVKKKLFGSDRCHPSIEKDSETGRTPSPILDKTYSCLDKKKFTNDNIKKYDVGDFENVMKKRRLNVNSEIEQQNTEEISKKYFKNSEIIETPESDNSSEENLTTNKSHMELIAKVKSYFDNHFSSEASQQSISECETPTPKNSSRSSDEIEIFSPVSQAQALSSSLKDESTTSFENGTHSKKSTKDMFKKGGLAFRMNALLKKQTSNICLWQHEKFLAENSNFVIPTQEFKAFRIRNINFKFGVHLIQALCENNVQYLVAINNLYVNNNSFEINDVLRIYEPYSILVSNGSRIVVNVSKFDCSKFEFF